MPFELPGGDPGPYHASIGVQALDDLGTAGLPIRVQLPTGAGQVFVHLWGEDIDAGSGSFFHLNAYLLDPTGARQVNDFYTNSARIRLMKSADAGGSSSYGFDVIPKTFAAGPGNFSFSTYPSSHGLLGVVGPGVEINIRGDAVAWNGGKLHARIFRLDQATAINAY